MHISTWKVRTPTLLVRRVQLTRRRTTRQWCGLRPCSLQCSLKHEVRTETGKTIPDMSRNLQACARPETCLSMTLRCAFGRT